ncbi:DUF2784 domain-containing protein [Pollutimonas thiosulfatoxidans]|uniref:DUF2784 domain-containing protein n=1 Tax=Pollutimonas thiosulfatoxidans TaxID=2028345 RepID=A0A410GAA9_9BURK|nr:DUF2784 domain-containing protein [Pollutimonas thiosulfatoxidans]MBF6617297.1 DUF2784 domain-containing protein [Candidimonas sp.]NYT44882.1 DUF2784 domain-containing protein [Alcaligenaceae bacterium]QAA93250.1 hypothetical protein CKA81_04915 [Pollutimonas thiosulfatoxidans]
MLYLALAHLVLLIHAAFVTFVAFGGLLALWRPRMAYLHLPALAWGATVVAMGWICPLTPLENWLRMMAGKEQYEGGFIEHYLTMLVYPPGLTRDTQILLAILLVVANVAIYAVWYGRRRRAKGQTS